MTDDFDVSLRRRLESLAKAVPVVPLGRETSVVSRGVRARSSSRLAIRGLIPVLTVLAIGALVASILGIGGFLPGSGDEAGAPSPSLKPSIAVETGPIVAMTQSGGFSLTIRSPRERYAAGEPIDVEATFSHSGEEPVDIYHSREGSPLDFGIVEPVLGDLVLGPGGRLPCIGTMLEPGYSESAAFRKSGSWTSADPLADEYEAFTRDPLLRLSEGTWHIYAVARFSIDECGNAIEMRAELEIDVAASVDPESSASAVHTAEPLEEVHAVAEDGPFRLELRSNRAVYVAGAPIDIRATLNYFGAGRSVADFSGHITLIGHQTDGAHSFLPGPMVDMCVIRPIEDLPIETALADWPKVRSLPAGRWRITASFSGSAPACTFDGQGVRAWIDITVVPAGEPAQTIPLLTATDVEEVSSDRFCRNETPHASGGELSLDPSSGLGLASESGDIQPVRWPPGFSAEVLPDGAILYGASGQIVAREGDLISFPAGIASDGVLSACGQFLSW